MKVIVIFLVILLVGLAVRKPLLLHLYLQLAIGRTTKLLRFLEQTLTRSGNRDEQKSSILMVDQRALDGVNHLCRKKAGYDLRDYSTLDAMKHCRFPVFFAHGTGDHFVPYEMTVKNYEACAGRKMLYTAEGASHTKSYIASPSRYMEALTEFFH